MRQHIYVMRVEGAVLCSGLEHVGVKSAIRVTACDNVLIIRIYECVSW